MLSWSNWPQLNWDNFNGINSNSCKYFWCFLRVFFSVSPYGSVALCHSLSLFVILSYLSIFLFFLLYKKEREEIFHLSFLLFLSFSRRFRLFRLFRFFHLFRLFRLFHFLLLFLFFLLFLSLSFILYLPSPPSISIASKTNGKHIQKEFIAFDLIMSEELCFFNKMNNNLTNVPTTFAQRCAPKTLCLFGIFLPQSIQSNYHSFDCVLRYLISAFIRIRNRDLFAFASISVRLITWTIRTRIKSIVWSS